MTLLTHRLRRLAMLVAFAATASAQITGDLRGVVIDPSGAAVSQAKVTLRDLETGQTRTTQVNEEGQFGFSLLRIGSYEVRAEASGFRVMTARADVRTGEIADMRL